MVRGVGVLEETEIGKNREEDRVRMIETEVDERAD